MSRLTELIDIDGMKIKTAKERPLSNQGLGEILWKLYDIEQLEEQLGCSLDVVFKAIEDGIVIIGDLKENGDMTLWLDKKPLIALIGEKRNFEEPRLIKYNEWCFSCESGSYSGCVALKDYGKTWWLKGEK